VQDPYTSSVPCTFSDAMPKTYLAGMAGTSNDKFMNLADAKAACSGAIGCGGITLETSGRSPYVALKPSMVFVVVEAVVYCGGGGGVVLVVLLCWWCWSCWSCYCAGGAGVVLVVLLCCCWWWWWWWWQSLLVCANSSPLAALPLLSLSACATRVAPAATNCVRRATHNLRLGTRLHGLSRTTWRVMRSRMTPRGWSAAQRRT
jgi:hypothetical protein